MRLAALTRDEHVRGNVLYHRAKMETKDRLTEVLRRYRKGQVGYARDTARSRSGFRDPVLTGPS
jgi:hypothetical protein